jgi:hypothetical protein
LHLATNLYHQHSTPITLQTFDCLSPRFDIGYRTQKISHIEAFFISAHQPPSPRL